MFNVQDHPIDRLVFSNSGFDRLTHYLFRYPAKFHPPVVRSLIENFTEPGGTLLDPFCGSGTLLVEAAVLGRHAIGIDVDPVAVFVSRVKTYKYNLEQIQRSWRRLAAVLVRWERHSAEYQERMFRDLTDDEYRQQGEGLWIPGIPNIHHWFRRYVIIDLARIGKSIGEISYPQAHKDFFLLTLASVIRSVSNADPVPVSGLEVTIHMRRLEEKGRLINPISKYREFVEKGLVALGRFASAYSDGVRIDVKQGDAARMASCIKRKPTTIITSPPYHGAVDYYRRHTLEMYWLGFCENHSDRLNLLSQYLGRPKVPMKHPYLASKDGLPPLVLEWEERMRSCSVERANAFLHYAKGMRAVLRESSRLLRPGCLAVFILGRSTWNGEAIPTSRLFAQLGEEWFSLDRQLWYPLKNRYMSYSRRNGADINQEQVLVLRRRN